MVLRLFIKDFLWFFFSLVIFALFSLKEITFKINIGVYTKVLVQNIKR